LGILQMEANGRPDGKRPFGRESFLDYYLSILENHIAKRGSDDEFHLTREECFNLQQEAVQYYHRYLGLFHLGDYERVVRDTARNLQVFDLVKEYAENPKDQLAFEQFRPYVLMMRTRAVSSLAIQKKDLKKAIETIQQGIQQIEEILSDNEMEGQMENSPELIFLRRWLEEISDMKSFDPIERIRHELAEAVQNENYELAAKLRDQLEEMEKPPTSQNLPF